MKFKRMLIVSLLIFGCTTSFPMTFELVNLYKNPIYFKATGMVRPFRFDNGTNELKLAFGGSYTMRVKNINKLFYEISRLEIKGSGRYSKVEQYEKFKKDCAGTGNCFGDYTLTVLPTNPKKPFEWNIEIGKPKSINMDVTGRDIAEAGNKGDLEVVKEWIRLR